MEYYRNVIKITWVEKGENEFILFELVIEKGFVLRSTKKKRTLAYFAHIKRRQSLEKIIVAGKMPGYRSRSRPKKNRELMTSRGIRRPI